VCIGACVEVVANLAQKFSITVEFQEVSMGSGPTIASISTGTRTIQKTQARILVAKSGRCEFRRARSPEVARTNQSVVTEGDSSAHHLFVLGDLPKAETQDLEHRVLASLTRKELRS
jgi:hypothetical protein